MNENGGKNFIIIIYLCYVAKAHPSKPEVPSGSPSLCGAGGTVVAVVVVAHVVAAAAIAAAAVVAAAVGGIEAAGVVDDGDLVVAGVVVLVEGHGCSGSCCCCRWMFVNEVVVTRGFGVDGLIVDVSPAPPMTYQQFESFC